MAVYFSQKSVEMVGFCCYFLLRAEKHKSYNKKEDRIKNGRQVLPAMILN